MGRPIKVGFLKGVDITFMIPAAASLDFDDRYGHFVYVNSSGDLVIAATSSVAVIGWALSGETAASSTAAAEERAVNFATDAVYIIPGCTAGAAITEANCQAALGKTADFYTSSLAQYCDIETGGADGLMIVGYEYYGSSLGQQYLYVKIHPYGITTAQGV